jgi:alkylhydroperoxidase family enzyme
MAAIDLATASGLLSDYFATDIPAILLSAPGIGKSDSIKAAATEWLMSTGAFSSPAEIGETKHGKKGFIDIRAGLRDPVDFSGLPDTSGEFTVWKKPDFLPRVERDGEFGVICFDEFTNAGLSTQGALYQLFLDRALNDYVLPPGWRLVAAGNRMADKAAAQRLSTAFVNRVAVLEIAASVAAWIAWARRSGIHPAIIDCIQWSENRGESILHVMPKNDGEAFPSPRAWAAVSRFISRARFDNWRAGIAGLIGDKAAAVFMGFVEIWRTMPKLETVFADPNGAPVPLEHGGRFAVACAVSRELTAANIAKGFAYLERVGAEFKAMAVADAMARDPDLKDTDSFVSYSLANQRRAL